METEVTNLKNKTFFLLLSLGCHENKYLYLNTSIHYCKVTVDRYKHKKFLLQLTLTWLLSSFGVKLDNGVGNLSPRSPPKLTVFNRHPLLNNPVTHV